MDFFEIPRSDYELPGHELDSPATPPDGPKGLLRKTGSFENRGRKRKSLVWASGEWLLLARSASAHRLEHADWQHEKTCTLCSWRLNFYPCITTHRR